MAKHFRLSIKPELEKKWPEVRVKCLREYTTINNMINQLLLAWVDGAEMFYGEDIEKLKSEQ